MNDELCLNNYLMILKSTVEVYVHGTIESSNSDVRDLLKEGLDKTLIHQANTYDEMTKYNYYSVNNIECNLIEDTLNKLESKN